MNQKLKDLITLFIVQLVLTLPFYTASVYGLTISNVRVTKVTSNSATIEWNTGNVSDGKVKYGKTVVLGFTQRHDNFVSSHSLTLSAGMETDTSYFFAVESTDATGATAVDNNANNFYTFKTTDVTPPPQVTGLKASTTQNNILLSWDNVNAADFDHYVIYRNRDKIATTTTNSFNELITISADTSYKVSAVDKSNNEGSQSDTLIVSSQASNIAPPVISNVDDLPISESSVKIIWHTDKNSTSIVFYGINKTDKVKESQEFGMNHSVIIDGLEKNQKYNYIVKSCTLSNTCANSSHSIDAKARDTTPPSIQLTIPRYVNRKFIDINGSTKPFTRVNLFVNDMNIPKRSLSFNEVGASGKFFFSQVQLEQNNVIKVAMVDKFGNQNEKRFDVSVDTEEPVVKLNPIGNLTSKTNFTISGTVNEPVTIKVFIEGNLNLSASSSDSEIAAVTGLKATKVGKNSVELHWDESKDKSFSHYAVYRTDIGAIAVTKPSNFNLFIDALVDSGKSYTYQVSAVNIFSKESEKSEPITVTTLPNGSTLNINPSPVDIFEVKDTKKPDLTTNASGNFNIGIKLSKGDGTYSIKLIFEDKASNSVAFERIVTLDTVKPTVKIISPPSGALIFENVANEVDVIGKTKPNARVHLFVERTPFGAFNQSFQISGLPNEIQNLPESQLESKCKLEVASRSFCTGADRSATADSQGNFRFENVDLTVIFGGAARVNEVTASELRDTLLNQEASQSKRVNLLVIATDQLGQRGAASQTVNIGTCWSGNQSWDIIPLIQYQSPALLSTERLAEGTETISFLFNYSYIGAGRGARIINVFLAKACSQRELLDPRYNISCQILQAGASAKGINPPENTITYSEIPLNRFPGMDQFLQDDWESFLKAINKELTFPFKVTISYQHDTDGDGTLEKETQTTCQEVSYVVDNSLIDPRSVLPDWLLFDFVSFLNDSINVLNEVQEQIDTVLEYVVVGCVASWGLNFALQVYRRWVTFWDEKKFALKGDKLDAFFNAFKFNQDSKTDEECKNLVKLISKNKGGFSLKYVNDIDLKKCFPASAAAWEKEAKVYTLSRWSCDRVFGHSAPSRWTEDKSDQDLLNKIEKGEGCAVDESVQGQPLTAERCDEFGRKNPTYKAAANFGADVKCTLMKTREGDEVYTIGNPVAGSDRLYELKHVTREGDLSGKTKYAVKDKRVESRFITARTKTCAEVCGVKSGTTKGTFEGADGKTFEIFKDPKSGKKSEALAGCTTVDNCISLNANKEVPFGNEQVKINYAYTAGFTSNCFYDRDRDSVDVVGPDSKTMVVCCCINAKEGGISNYYAPSDIDPVTGGQVHESKIAGETGQLVPVAINNYADMKWSYRYWKEKFAAQGTEQTLVYDQFAEEPYLQKERTGMHTEYNPNRYIEGRDLPACFGQNNLLYQAFNEQEKVLRVDPFQQHEAAFQCLHIAGIRQRIVFIKNLMSSLSTCLIQVRTTGRGDGGACKELFSQYLCNSIWQVIRWFVDGCAPIGLGKEFAPDDLGIADIVRAGFGSVYRSALDTASQITEEYGNAKLNELLGTGEESIARKICLGAFGYDWELGINNFVDAAYATPYATLVQPITRSREFLTVHPLSFKPKYEYRASWIINPGCDFDSYNVQLVCVGRKQLDKYPNSVNCGAIGAPSVAYTGQFPGTGPSAGYSQCDCVGLPDERIASAAVAQGTLKQSVLEDKKAIHLVREDNVRYDHLKFTLRPDRKIDAKNRDKCFPSGYEDGVFYFPLIDKTPRDIFGCSADPLSGSFTCGTGSTFGSQKGTAEFISIKLGPDEIDYLNKQELVFGAGDTIQIVPTIRNVGKDKCLKSSLDRVVFDVAGITQGTNQYPIISPVLTLGQEQVKANYLQVRDAGSTNEIDVGIDVKFYDTSRDGQIDFSSDEVKIDSGEIIRISGLLDSEQKLIISKNGARVQVESAAIRRTDGKSICIEKVRNLENVECVSDTIRILKAQQQGTTPTQPQPKTLTLTLVNLRQDVETYQGNPDDCNFNDFVVYGEKQQTRDIPIRVELRTSKEAALQGPIIDAITINSVSITSLPKVKKGDIVILSIRFRNPNEVKSALFSYTTPDGTSGTAELKLTSKGFFEVQIGTHNLGSAGEFRGTITAESKVPNAKKAEKEIKFDVQCGGENNEYGLCDIYGECKAGTKTIPSALPCPPPPGLST